MDRSQAESAARTAWNFGDYAETTRIAFEIYGQELYSFALAQFPGQPSQADDVFSQFSEDFWISLPQFMWRCSLRAWCYKLLRNAAHRFRRHPFNHRRRRADLSAIQPWLDEFVAQTRTQTQPHLRSEVKDEIRQLREKLRRGDQDLLILRVDRDMPWREIADSVLPMDDASEDEIRRFEVALRRRFTEVKKRLRALAHEAGLL